MKKTHKVIDLIYHEDEGNEAYVGSYQQCQDWVSEQGGFGFQVVSLSQEEMLIHNIIE